MSIIRTAAGILSASLAVCLSAGAQTKFVTQPVGTSIKLTGTSTMHDWEMEGSTIGGFLELPAGVTLDKAQAAPTGMQGDKIEAKSHVLIPVGSIHSKAEHSPEIMDNLMKKNMKESDFHVIDYKLAELTFKGPHTPGTPFDFEAKGDLNIAGKTKTVTFPISIEPLDGKIRIKGTAPVKMTEYGVDPPAPDIGLGLMKCGDDVKIIFDWTLKEKK